MVISTTKRFALAEVAAKLHRGMDGSTLAVVTDCGFNGFIKATNSLRTILQSCAPGTLRFRLVATCNVKRGCIVLNHARSVDKVDGRHRAVWRETLALPRTGSKRRKAHHLRAATPRFYNRKSHLWSCGDLVGRERPRLRSRAEATIYDSWTTR